MGRDWISSGSDLNLQMGMLDKCEETRDMGGGLFELGTYMQRSVRPLGWVFGARGKAAALTEAWPRLGLRT